MKLSFVCPCYNEADNVEPFFNAVKETFKNDISYEIVFINDGSRDNTYKKLIELKNTCSANMKIIHFSRNFGKEAAIYAGLEHAEGDLTCIIDTDLQQNPATVKQMLEILDNNPQTDCVCAFQENRHEGKLTIACKNTFYKLADRITETTFRSGASDFRTFRKNVKDAILSMGEYHRFSKGIFGWVGFDTEYIPYVAEERLNGKSSFNFIKLLNYAINGIIDFSTLPLKFASYIGSFAVLFSIIYAIVTIIRKLTDHINVDGFTQLAILLVFFGGIQLFTIGIIGKYLAKNYIETKKRPIYIAKDIIEYKKDI